MKFNPYNTNATKTPAKFYSWPITERVITYGIPHRAIAKNAAALKTMTIEEQHNFDNVEGIMYGLFNNDPDAVARDIETLIEAFTPTTDDVVMIKPIMTFASVLASVAACADTGYAERDAQHVLYAAKIAFSSEMYLKLTSSMQLSEEQKDPSFAGARLATALYLKKSVVKISKQLKDAMELEVKHQASIGNLSSETANFVIEYIGDLVK